MLHLIHLFRKAPASMKALARGYRTAAMGALPSLRGQHTSSLMPQALSSELIHTLQFLLANAVQVGVSMLRIKIRVEG